MPGNRAFKVRSKNRVVFPNPGEEIKELDEKIKNQAPAHGTLPIGEITQFAQLPISKKTLAGLDRGQFTVMTEIQQGAIFHGLAGRDILGAAKTGSGKTISFIIPLLESLYRSGFEPKDGLGALVISPTRELALQIFEVLRIIGKFHQFSAGLVTGGKKGMVYEQREILRINILIATPGRLLQHFEQTPGFSASLLQILILDEADRILDMGFSEQLNSILTYLPSERQTLLFSATQTKSVKDLARLSLKEPEYISVHEQSDSATPPSLIQNYLICDLSKKMDILFGFIKSHLKSKCIIFFNTTSQVRFIFECFCQMHPGVPLIALHGKYKQAKRTTTYYEFCQKTHACLFATDIAARGLDFPAVDWVIQFDAPEDTAMYIHRVGRTARYKSGGKALLFLLPSEIKMAESLIAERIPIKKINTNPQKTFSITPKVSAFVASDPECKRLAQKAFTSYIRSVHLMPNKEIFKVQELATQGYAGSLGLATIPSLKYLEDNSTIDREGVRKKKNVNRALERLKEQIRKQKEERKKMLATTQQENKDISKNKKEQKKLPSSNTNQRSSESENSSDDDDDDDDSEDDDKSDNSEDELFVVKQRHDWSTVSDDTKLKEDLSDEDAKLLEKKMTTKQILKQLQKKQKLRIDSQGKASRNSKIVFNEDDDDDDDDDDNDNSEGEGEGEVKKKKKIRENKVIDNRVPDPKNLKIVDGDEIDMKNFQKQRQENIQRVQKKLEQNAALDKLKEKQRIQEKHKKRRLKDKKDRAPDEEEEEEVGVQLASGNESEDDNDDNSSEYSNDIEIDYQRSNQKKQKLQSINSSDDDDEDSEDQTPVDKNKLKEQEQLALKILRNR